MDDKWKIKLLNVKTKQETRKEKEKEKEKGMENRFLQLVYGKGNRTLNGEWKGEFVRGDEENGNGKQRYLLGLLTTTIWPIGFQFLSNLQ